MRAQDLSSVDELRRASVEVVAPSLAEEGCIGFSVLFDENDPLLLRFYEAYIDEESFNSPSAPPRAKI
jgi:quinol monooxygenase YgiN